MTDNVFANNNNNDKKKKLLMMCQRASAGSSPMNQFNILLSL